MRIGIDIKHFKHGSTGIATYLKCMMDSLQEIDKINEYFLFECIQSEYTVSNPKWKKILIPWKNLGTIWQQFILPFFLYRYKVEVLWSPEQTCPILFMKTIRIVTTIHDLVFIHYPRTCQISTRIVFSALTPYVLRKSDALVAVSEYIKQDVIREFKHLKIEEKIFSIPNGKPKWEVPENYSASKRKEFLFFPGNLEPRKNLKNLIKALIILKKKDLIINLHLAGPKGWKNRNLLNLLNRSEVSQQIKYMGYLDETKLKIEYLTCKALIYPSIYEGFGLPILEALCLDCLILTSKGTVMEEIANDSAIFFDANNPECIADSIEKIYKPEFNREIYLSEKKKEKLKNYSWDLSAEKLLTVLTQRKIRSKNINQNSRARAKYNN